ncbi:uncharacterized protein LOC134789590 [Cydia splendana]|uniref:uncharacterized protein LOC134789590 n=1 Tax=Cydia splendana TaxID=1100963 RepID=UPI00300CE525
MAPLTAAEKQRRYKEKLKRDPEKYEEYKRKKRENYHAKKRLVKALTPKEHYNAKVIWKLKKRNLRQKRQVLNRILDNTPPSSPLHVQENIPQPVNLQDNICIRDMQENIPPLAPLDMQAIKRGRKKVNRDRTKLYRDNLRLKKENKNLKRLAEKYRKRPKTYYPIANKNANVRDSNCSIDNLREGDMPEPESDDDLPLSLIVNSAASTLEDIDITDLCGPRSSTFYDAIYDDEEQPSTSTRGQQNKEDRPTD